MPPGKIGALLVVIGLVLLLIGYFVLGLLLIAVGAGLVILA